MTLAAFNPFQGEEHRPFHWPAGRMAALLVHGFPGTPAEMRHVGQLLHSAGWTVQGLLLPGFGAEMKRLSETKPEDWINATADHVQALRRSHDHVVLVGYSMGGAVAINAVRQARPDQLVLISPFWQLGNGWQNRFWPVLRLLFRSLKPFQRADFNNPKVRNGVRNFMPDVDLDDPAVQTELRQMTIPSSFLDGLRSIGQMAFQNAPHVATPGIVIQGRNDQVVGLDNTRQLVRRLGNGFQYHEIDGDHLLIDSGNAGFARLTQHLLAYLQPLAPSTPAAIGGQRGDSLHKDE